MDAPRLLEAMPTFTREEKMRFLSVSSLDFNMFFCNGNPRDCVERFILFKGNRVLEACYEKLLKKDMNDEATKDQLFKVMFRWGHIALLAQDWAKALSAYEYAYRTRPNEFWKDPSGYYGLGLVYLHFKEYTRAAESFARLLYSYPTLDIIMEAKVRLGVCYHFLSDYPNALKFYAQALSDTHDTVFLNRTNIRFNMAMAKESTGELCKAEEEYKGILEELAYHAQHVQNGMYTSEQAILTAAINRQLGWICYRQPYTDATSEERTRRLHEAEQFLLTAKNQEPQNGKTFYFLGRCYGELPAKVTDIHPPAHEAFINYRHSIDKSEADADTWCSIGWLYQQQSQPMDALQAFVCAVELDAEHSAAWTDLGRLYELNNQFEDALSCFRNAIKFNSAAPEALKARILVLEKELQTTSFSNQQRNPQQNKLPSLKEAWNQPIPSELRQRQEEFLKQKQQPYRDGSALWRMGELAAPLAGIQESLGPPPLETTQMAMMRLLQVNKDRINDQERTVLEQLENRHRICQDASFDSFFSSLTASSLPTFTEAELNQVKEGSHLSGVANVKKEAEDEPSSSGHDDMTSSARHKEELDEKGAGQDGNVSSTGDLPITFSLDAKLRVPLDICSAELMELCGRRVDRPMEFQPIFDERVAPPRPPTPPVVALPDVRPTPGQSHPLLRATPLVVVESRKDAQSAELQRFCESTPIALIRGLTAVLKMDLSLFSTKTLRESAADHEVEVRTQYRMPCDLNVDHLGEPTWECMSTRSFTTVNKYAQYQAETFQHSLKEEAEKLRSAGAKYAQQIAENGAKRRRGPNGEEWAMPMKMIKFGTNVDLSDEQKWPKQLGELAKMPPFCRLIAGCNMLSHLGHTVLGMNTVQLYMKVPGSRTPAHQENNSFASININIGPGDCEWFGVPTEYWGTVEKMCKKRGINFLKGSYWPNFEDLLEEGVPVYRFTQKAGDLVWVGGGCVHWVQATGWCNNIAWNVGPVTHQQLALSISSYEWNKLQGYKSLVPMQHLCWQLAKNIKFTNQKVYSVVRGQIIRSLAFCKMVADWATHQGKQLKPQARCKGEITHYCTLCEVEVFNILFTKEMNGKFPVYCVYCARRIGLSDFIVLQQLQFHELTKILDEMQMNLIPKASLVC